MPSLSDYFNHRRASYRIISRLLNGGEPMTAWQIVGTTGLCYATIYNTLRHFKSENLIHIDRWYHRSRYGSKPMPMYVKGDYPDAPKHVKRPRSVPRLRRQKEKYYMDKHEARVSAETDWNGIMHGLVKGKQDEVEDRDR